MSNGPKPHASPEDIEKLTEALQKYEALSEEAKRLLGRCWEYDHQKWHNCQRMQHAVAIAFCSLVWLLGVSWITGGLAEKIGFGSSSSAETTKLYRQYAEMLNDEKADGEGDRNPREEQLAKVLQALPTFTPGIVLVGIFVFCATALPIALLVVVTRRSPDE